MDIKILWMTIIRVLKGEGISQKGHATMEKFEGTEQPLSTASGGGMVNVVETVTCPLCGFNQNKPFLTETINLKGYNYNLGINECKSCGLCYVSPRLNDNGLSILYNEEYINQTVSGVNHVTCFRRNDEISDILLPE